MPLTRLPEVTALVRDRLVREVAAGFPTLTRIPSSGVIQFLDYFATLPVPDREALLDSRAQGGALQFFPPRDAYDAALQHANHDPAVLRYRAALHSGPLAMGLRYQDLRMIKVTLGDPMSVAMMAQTRSTLSFVPRDDFPPNLVPDQDPKNLKPAKAPLLRKLIDAAFKSLFAGSREKRPGGELLYSGVCRDTPLTIGLIFTNRGPQLLYHIKIPDDSHTVFCFRFTYESLWGAVTGWDYLTEENAEAAIACLGELIVQSVDLRNSIYALLRPA